MPSFQKIALFISFDAIERDLISKIRDLNNGSSSFELKPLEEEKAKKILSLRELTHNLDDHFELLDGLDMGQKFDILLRNKSKMDDACKSHYEEIKPLFDQCLSVRNTVMHGRPLTMDEYAKAFALTNKLKNYPIYWPELVKNLKIYADDPNSISEKAISFLDEFEFSETLNNLPLPDYDDTGFFPRPKLEKELKNKILGRHPVVTVLGDGGDGKTAVTLQTLYGLLFSCDHDFDAIIWVSAKSSKLSVAEVIRIKTEITNSLSIFGEVANIFETKSEEPIEQVLKLMEENKILLVIDNLETIIDKTIQDFATDIPGESKLLLTSRIPLGSDLTVKVNPFSNSEAVSFLRALISAYEVNSLRRESQDKLQYYANRLLNKPLLLKWFALGVLSGLEPAKIIGNPEIALKFCLENVFEALDVRTKKHLSALATLPRAVSLAMLEYVTGDEIRTIEASMAELMRFAIVEQRSDAAYETVFHIKSLAKSYLVRVLKSKHTEAEQIIKKFREIEAIYQTERVELKHNKYNPLHYTVRSKSEALAVAKLRRAVSLARTEDFLKSFEIIDDLKISHPDYYEVPRTEAYIAQLSGYTPRAQEAFVLALETGKSQPQIHLFYGWFLRQVFNDFDGALEQFKSGLLIDPISTSLLAAAAQVCMFNYDFDAAQGYLDSASKQYVESHKERAILCDIQIQVFSRELEYLFRKEDYSQNAEETIKKMQDYVSRIDAKLLDATLVRHLETAKRNMLAILPRLNSTSASKQSGLSDAIAALLLSQESKTAGNSRDDEHTSDPEIGFLKEAGRKPGFGFLVGTSGTETYVDRNSVNPQVWRQLLLGRKVRFNIQKTPDGRTKATNTRLFSD